MPRIEVPFVVKKQHIKRVTDEDLVAGGQNYFYATFEIGSNWKKLSNIKASFVRDDVKKVVDLYEVDGHLECEIPWEVMATAGVFQVGVFGGDRLLTHYTYVKVKRGCTDEGDEPVAPTPDWFAVMEKKCDEAVATANDIVERADAGEFDGKDGEDGYTPVKGVDYFDGKDGKDGVTPVKGVDYFTPDEVDIIAEEAAKKVDIGGGTTPGALSYETIVEGELTEGGVTEIVTSIPVDLTQFKQLQFFAEVKVAEVASGTSCVHWMTISDKSHATYNVSLLRHTVSSKGEVDYTWCCDTDIHKRADEKYAFWSKFYVFSIEGNNGIVDLRTMISSTKESNLVSTTLPPHLLLRITNTTFEAGTKFVLRGVK